MTKETKAVAKIGSYEIVPETINDIKDAINTNMDGEELAPRDLFTVIKIPAAGGLSWTVPTFDGEEERKTLKGLILFIDHSRAMFEGEYGDENVSPVPLCASNDCITGIGDPGGACETCPYNEYKSASKGAGKACRESRIVYFLAEGEVMPYILKVSAGSFKALKKYRVKLLTAGIKMYCMETSFTLKRSKSTGNVTYSEVVFTAGSRITDKNMIASIESYRKELEPFITPPAATVEAAPAQTPAQAETETELEMETASAS